MSIPPHLVPLVCQLAHEHLVSQVHQVRRMGHDHPQSFRAHQHLEQARELASLCPARAREAA